MSHLPLPVRVAVGLALTAVEQARKLPEQLADLPVTAASRAVQAGMRVQQRVTELAIKGDEVFLLFRPVEDTPSWATFDEDDNMPESGSAVAPARSSTPVTTEFGEIDEADVAQALTPPRSTATPARPDASLNPSALTSYDGVSLAQLRGKLRKLSLPQLEEMLDYERGHEDRPAFVTLLSNRIATVRSQTTESQ